MRRSCFGPAPSIGMRPRCLRRAGERRPLLPPDLPAGDDAAGANAVLGRQTRAGRRAVRPARPTLDAASAGGFARSGDVVRIQRTFDPLRGAPVPFAPRRQPPPRYVASGSPPGLLFGRMRGRQGLGFRAGRRGSAAALGPSSRQPDDAHGRVTGLSTSHS